MDGTILFLVLLMAALLIGSAVASGSETALFSLSHADQRATEHGPPGRAIARLLARPRVLLLLVLVINMTVNVTYFAAASVLSARTGGLAAAAVGAGSVLTIVLVGEVLAKLIARTTRRGFARLVAPPLLALRTLLALPLAALDRLALGPLARLIAPGASAPAPAGADELSALVESQADRFSAEEKRWLSRVLGLGDLRASAVMTPRVDLVWVDEHAGAEQVRAALARAGHHLLPVCPGGLDRGISGVLDAKRYLAAAELRPTEPPPISRFTRAPLFVPERARLDRVLARFRAEGRSIAVCVDEPGDVAGLIEIEHIIEAILGEPARSAGQARHAQAAGLGVWDVPARLGLHEFADQFRRVMPAGAMVRLNDAQADTLGGLVGELLGRVPAEGDEAELGEPGSDIVRLRVVAVSGRAVESVRVLLPAGAGPAHAAATGDPAPDDQPAPEDQPAPDEGPAQDNKPAPGTERTPREDHS